MDKAAWTAAVRQRLARLGRGIRTITPDLLYSALAASTFIPVVAAGQENLIAVAVALGNVLGAVGGNLLANQIQIWKDKTELELAGELAQKAASDKQWRETLDTLLREFKAPEVVYQGLAAADRTWFVQTLEQSLARMGSGISIQVDAQGTLVMGDRNITTHGDVRESIQSIGDNTHNTQYNIKTAHFEAPVPPGQVDPQRLLETYLEGIVHDTRLLPLTGVDRRTMSETDSARLELAGVYTALDTTQMVERTEGKRSRPRRPQTADAEREMADFLGRETERLSGLAFVSGKHKYTALLGDPGSGKTTFVNFLALCLAGEQLGQSDANLAKLGDEWTLGPLLPVRVVLRDYAATLNSPLLLGEGVGVRSTARRKKPPPGEWPTLWDYITHRLGQSLDGFAPILKRHLLTQGGVLILDGFDEVPEAEQRRAAIKQAVQEFRRAFPAVRILLTSRIYAYQGAWRLPGFEDATLAPFSPDQINAFVDGWYTHLATVRRDWSAAEAETRAGRLKEAIQYTPHLAELAPRPLLLTLMASLDAWWGRLPEDREQLYDESVQLLLHRWESQKEYLEASGHNVVEADSLAQRLGLTRPALQRALEGLAYRVHAAAPSTDRGTADIAEDALVGALIQAAGGARANPDLPYGRVIQYLNDRAGLLIQRAEHIYSFPHRTFQEYLAARELCERDTWETLVNHVRQDTQRWREVVLLAGAKAKTGRSANVWDLVRHLCPYPFPPLRISERGQIGEALSDADWYSILLAGQVLVETGVYHSQTGDLSVLNAQTLQQVRGWLARLLSGGQLPPVDRAAAGRTLAVLGDRRKGVSITQREDGAWLPDIDWVPIEAGPFIMGSDPDKDEFARDSEQPQFTCQLIRRPYRISRHPITVAQYKLFVDAKGYEQRRYWTESGWDWREREGVNSPYDFGSPFSLDNHPQVGVSWYEAVAYCAWLTEQLGAKVSLPSEAQWERAARGNDGRIYPWGNDFDPARCNMDETGIGTTCAVGVFLSDNDFAGPADMSGNVLEWCNTKWLTDYEDYEVRADDDLVSNSGRVVRGGAWVNVRGNARSASRFRLYPDRRLYDIGLRLVLPSTI